MVSVLIVNHKEERIEQRPIWRLFLLSRQNIIMVKIRGNSSGNNEKWLDCGSILKNFLMHLAMGNGESRVSG